MTLIFLITILNELKIDRGIYYFMKRIKTQIEMILSGKEDGGILGEFLNLISLGYGTILRLRVLLYHRDVLKSRKLACPVISVGNITLGGTGKTPVTLYLARMLIRLGFQPAILSRGYRGRFEQTGGIVSDGRRVLADADAAGDEPFMMARQLAGVPVLAGSDRYQSGMTAIQQFHPDVMILDDAFQHLRLKRDLNILLLDAARPFGNGKIFPRGRLREPLSGLKRADVFILTRSEIGREFPLPDEIAALAPVFRSFHVPYIYKVEKGVECSAGLDVQDRMDGIMGRIRVFAFSGIADNQNFFDTLNRMGWEIGGTAGFPDHHTYSPEDLDHILTAARLAGADTLATTEKDWVRLPKGFSWPLDAMVIGIEISLGRDEAEFIRFITSRIPTPGRG
jgi:tetraacyldisaccharide 4'-kinase